MQKQIMNSAHAQDQFQLKLYENLMKISNSKSIKQRLKDQIAQMNLRSSSDEDPTEIIYNLKD
jgi:hypothetical protein